MGPARLIYIMFGILSCRQYKAIKRYHADKYAETTIAEDGRMSDEPTFVDLYALTKITPDSVVERFGSSINCSFFDASNILGGLKIKKLIDFTTLFGNQNAITVTETGKHLLDEAAGHAIDQFDHLDLTVLMQLSKGGRTPNDISSSMNITPKALALHLYKMQEQQYLSAEFRNGNLNLALTEKGFMQARTGMPGTQPAVQQAATATAQAAEQGVQASQPDPVKKGRIGKGAKAAIAAAVVIIVLLAAWELGLSGVLGLKI